MKNSKVSLFKDYKTKLPSDIISLYDWVTTETFKDRVEHIRSISDKKQQRELKATTGIKSTTAMYYSEWDILILQG